MNTQTVPLVSVIMPVHNAGKFLVPAIESILAQTYKHLELIVVDDGSTDSSWNIMREFRKKYPKTVRIYHVAKQLNSAGNGATDVGLTYARGQFIARMDGDDVSLPKRIEKQVRFLLAHPEVILVGTQATIINGNGGKIGTKRVPTDHETIYEQYGVIHPVIHPSVMVRRSMLPDPNRLYLHKWGINDDYYSFFKLLNYGRFANLTDVLLKYRIHGKNASLTDVRQKFFNTVHIRIEAIRSLKYRVSVKSVLMMAMQTAVVLIIPNRLLERIYPILRGMDSTPQQHLAASLARLKQVAMGMPFMRRYTLAEEL